MLDRNHHLLIAIAVWIACAALRVFDPAPVSVLRLRAFDWMQALRPRAYQRSTPVRIVSIDDGSLARIGQWPWPRGEVARLTERLQDAGAAAIAFDVLFSEPDRTAPARIIPLWPNTPLTKELLEAVKRGELPDPDTSLARIFRRGNVVTAFALNIGEGPPDPPARKAGVAFVGESPLPYLLSFPIAVNSLPALAEAAAGNGTVTVVKDPDSILRAVPLLLASRGEIYPSLAAEALRVAQAANTYVVKASGAAGMSGSAEQTGVVALKVGSLTVPTDPHGRILLYDTGPVTERFIPAWRVLADDFDRESVRGDIVLVGATAAGLFDVHATPLMKAVPGVVEQAQVIEQALEQKFLRRPAWADGAEIAFLTALSLVVIVAFALSSVATRWSALAGLAVVPSAAAVAWLAFSRHGLLLDPVYPSLVALAVYLSAALTSYLRSEAKQRFIRQAFRQYVSPEVVDRIAADASRLRLGGETRVLTVLFSDIRDFTGLAELLDAQSLTQLMNRYFTPMTEIVLRHGGTIDKYIGDAVMCFWNAPLDDPHHAAHACQAALAMRAGLSVLNQSLEGEAPAAGRSFRPLHIGVGINTGSCSVGNMGSEQRFDYSALGDPVNLASRLESQSKQYGVDIVVGEDTAAEAGDFALLELDQMRVKGKAQAKRIFALFGDRALRDDPDFVALREAQGALLEAYRRQDWTAAAAFLDTCRSKWQERFGLRTLYQRYEERIARFMADPPGPGWDGVYEATLK